MDPEALVNSYIVESDANERSRVASSLSKFPLLRTIKCLEDSLTQEDADVRAIATQCLSDTIKHKNELNASEIKVLSVFLCDRLEDSHSTEAATDGLTALLSKKQFENAGTLKSITDNIGKIDMLRMPVETRYQIYKYFLELCNKLQQMPQPNPVWQGVTGEEIAKNFISVASGEKDPRNLMLSLEISDRLLNLYKLNISEETRAELYDITFCYFPVKFNPPKDMPYKITTEEIKIRLKETISNPGLATWAIPGLLSKLTAVSVTVRIDSLDALSDSVKKLMVETKDSDKIDKLWRSIWEGTKFEVLNGTTESETYAPALKLLSNFSAIPEFQKAVLSEFSASENIPNNKIYQLCCTIIGLCNSEAVWDAMVPIAIEKCYDNLPAMNLFLNSPYNIPHLDEVFQSLLAANAGDKKKEAAIGMKRVALSRNGAEFVPLIVYTLTTNEEYDIIAEISKKYPDIIEEHFLPTILEKFPDPKYMHAAAKVCCVKPLIFAITKKLLPKLDVKDDPKSSLVLLLTLVEASRNLKIKNDNDDNELVGFHPLVVDLILSNFKSYTNSTNASNKLIILAGVILERASRGVTDNEVEAYVKNVTNYMDNVHFHLIFSSLVAVKTFPFPKDFVKNTVLKKLETGSTSDALEKLAYLRQLAVVSNKWYNDLEEYTALESYKLEKDFSPASLEIFAMITKGLLLRTNDLGFKNASLLTDFATNNLKAAEAFGILMAPDRMLTKENGCTVRPLYRQRLFVSSLPVLAEAGEEGKSTHEALVAVSSLLKYSPQSVVKSNFGKIFSLLLSSLDTSSEDLQQTAIETITSSLPESAPSIEMQLDMLVPILLKIGRSAKSASDRASAFKCLCTLRESLDSKMDGFREVIKSETHLAVGDPNREVRKYAVKCRQLQF